jgi:hypothetical protein
MVYGAAHLGQEVRLVAVQSVHSMWQQGVTMGRCVSCPHTCRKQQKLVLNL